MNFMQIARELREALRLFRERGGRMLSGAVAFYALLSIAPICAIVLEVAGRLTGADAAQRALIGELSHWVGPDGAQTVIGWIDGTRAHLHHGHGAIARILAIASLVYGSTRLWSQMQRALDHLWDTPRPPSGNARASVLRQIRKRGISFAIVLLAGLALTGLAVGHSALERMHEIVGDDEGSLPSRAFAAAGTFIATVFIFFVVQKTLPTRPAPAFATLRGAVVTAILFTLGALLAAAYVGHKANSSSYGAATSIVMLLLWVHYSAQVFFLGAAFTHVHSQPANPLPTANAEPPVAVLPDPALSSVEKESAT
jgi:membrane protein